MLTLLLVFGVNVAIAVIGQRIGQMFDHILGEENNPSMDQPHDRNL